MTNNTSELAPEYHQYQAYNYKFHTIQYELVRKRSKYCQLATVGNGLVVQMVEVYERGQIVIPKYIRDMLKIAPGTQLNVSLDGRKIVLEQSDPIEELDRIRAENAVYTTKELNKIMKELDKKKHDELMKDVY